MLDKHLNEIRKKEKKARENIKKARVEALKVIDKAHEEGMEMIEQVKIEMDGKRREYLAGAEAEAAGEVEAMRKKNREDIDSLNRRAERNRDEAMGIVLDILKR